jgi:hypothetical protein
VNADLTPALIAAGGGMSLMAGIARYEQVRDARMRAGRVRLGVRYPAGLEPAQVSAVWDGLAGLPYTSELVTELVAVEGRITHSLLVPAAARESVRAALAGVIPSARIAEAEPAASEPVTLSLRLFVRTPSLFATDNIAVASRSLLAGLVGVRTGETLILRWALAPGAPRPLREPDEPTPRQREIARAWRGKTATPGFSVDGLLLIRAAGRTRARELAAHIENVLRSRHGVVGGTRVTYERGNRTLASLPRVRRSSGWLSVSELVPLLGLPMGEVVPGVEVGSPEILAPRTVARNGRRLFTARDWSGERPVALSPEAATHHMAVIGPSGVGKSVLLANSILSDIQAGHGGVVIDPKADLVESVLRRIKPEHASRIVVLDGGDLSRPAPGVALLAGGDPDTRADVLTGTLKSIFAGVWGVRSEFYGRLAFRTLSEIPGASLADMGRLFYDEPYLLAAIARLSDPYVVSSWQGYLALSPAARADHVQAPMARVMTLLSRPRVRAILASPEPKLDVARLMAERKWLLVSLAPGAALSEAGATFVGAALMYVIWSAIEARVALPPERRHLICLYLDELATLTNGTPFGVELLAERARGLGAGLSVALQTLGRIGEPTRSALTGNLATMISFRAGATEAPTIARELPGISAENLVALGQYEVAARVGTGFGSGVAVVTGRTEPLPPETGQAEAIRDRSAALYGSELPASEPLTSTPAAPPDDETEPPRAGRTGRAA